MQLLRYGMRSLTRSWSLSARHAEVNVVTWGVQVDYMQPGELAKPNLYFARDHFFMTPQDVMSRMGSAARAGEERCSAAALAALGVPILMTVHGSGTILRALILSTSIRVLCLYPMECAPIGKVAARLLACCGRSTWNLW